MSTPYTANLYMIQSAACEQLQRYFSKDMGKNFNRLPFLGQMCHMGQAVELCNVIKKCGLYPSLSKRADDYTTEEFRTCFNHVKGRNKLGKDRDLFKANMNHLLQCTRFSYNESIKKTIMRAEKLFLWSNPSSALVYFLLEYYLHLIKILRSHKKQMMSSGRVTSTQD